MALSDLVTITISLTGPSPQVPNFGIPLILGCSNRFANADVVRSYAGGSSGLAQMVTDGFLTTDPEYIAAQALCASANVVPSFRVAKRTNKPTFAADWTPVAHNSTKYSIAVNGVLATITSGGSATVAAIVTAMKAAVDALSVTGLVTTDNTTKLTLSSATAGFWVRLGIDDPNQSGFVVNGTDAGIVADVTAVRLADDSWYGITLASMASDAEVLALAAYIESNGKMFWPMTQNTACVTVTPATDTAAGASGSIMARLQSAAYTRTFPVYGRDNGSFTGAAIMGAKFTTTPGTENWMFATLPGVVSDTPPMTAANVSNVTGTGAAPTTGKNGNVYITNAGINMLERGMGSGGIYADVIRGIDWLKATLQTNLFALMQQAPGKIPYTDAGIAMVEGVVRSTLHTAEGTPATPGLLAPGTTTISVPTAASVSSTDRSNRVLNNVTFASRLAGAINAIVVTGVVTY